MNKQREAIRWSMVITAAVILGLVVVWAAIALAYSRLSLAPLYFDAAPYRQDDYSAEGEDVARLNPLDPALEQEVILDDQAHSSLVPTVDSSALTNTPKPSSTSLPLPTRTHSPASTRTSLPAPTSTSLPPSTNTSLPAPTNTSIAPSSTKIPQPTKTPKPTKTSKPTKTPKPTKAPNKNDKLGGDGTVNEFRNKLLLALADGLNRIIKADKVMANILHELEKNLLLRIAISPAPGLLDAPCKFNLDQDGVSVGLGFPCVPVTFTTPGN